MTRLALTSVSGGSEKWERPQTQILLSIAQYWEQLQLKCSPYCKPNEVHVPFGGGFLKRLKPQHEWGRGPVEGKETKNRKTAARERRETVIRAQTPDGLGDPALHPSGRHLPGRPKKERPFPLTLTTSLITFSLQSISHTASKLIFLQHNSSRSSSTHKPSLSLVLLAKRGKLPIVNEPS